MAPIVVYDACVLYPAPLRDLFMRLALTDLFEARWTYQIHDEWTRNVLADPPDVTPESLIRCRELMDKHPDRVVEDAIIGTLPKNKLARQIARKLHVYAGPTHPHAAQQPVPYEIKQVAQ